ncbi:hypothetical protein [Streptomyces fulvoviolaceus]|uniref:hypothetical protein n=1 Tax=Streptomyces fulvoviolaceus TaxID=285535 RepID=UPI0021BE977A|nr:hypothetical protein [Streptomyces fulvoviolaceus]MCT9081314.1 hypothetical protein [Streptomyces fulvoviolaceus]
MAGDNGATVTSRDPGRSAADGGYQIAIPQKGEPHQRWRRQLSKYFTVKRMTALRPGMVEFAETLIDDMTEHGQPADLKAFLGFPLPVYVICKLLGVPAEDRNHFSPSASLWPSLAVGETRGDGSNPRSVRIAPSDAPGSRPDRRHRPWDSRR